MIIPYFIRRWDFDSYKNSVYRWSKGIGYYAISLTQNFIKKRDSSIFLFHCFSIYVETHKEFYTFKDFEKSEQSILESNAKEIKYIENCRRLLGLLEEYEILKPKEIKKILAEYDPISLEDYTKSRKKKEYLADQLEQLGQAISDTEGILIESARELEVFKKNKMDKTEKVLAFRWFCATNGDNIA